MTVYQNPPPPPEPPTAQWPSQQGPPPRKRRRVFMWTFLAIQVLFLAWVIIGLVTVHTGPSAADIAAGCDNGAWQGLFKSHADCVTHYGHALGEAGAAGKGVGLALVIALWVAVDVILGIGRLVVLTSRRRSDRAG